MDSIYMLVQAARNIVRVIQGRFSFVALLNPNITMQVFHSVLYTVPIIIMVITRSVCLINNQKLFGVDSYFLIFSSCT